MQLENLRPAPAPSFWTEERLALLIELHAKGLSGKLIAAEIPGSTKNSVIGKLSRIGVRPPTAPKISVKQNRKAIAAEVVIPLTLMQLEKHSCRWPLWGNDAPDAARFFCSAYAPGVEAMRPYCRTHTKKAASHAPLYLQSRPYIPART